jgi:hypothetical protein
VAEATVRLAVRSNPAGGYQQAASRGNVARNSIKIALLAESTHCKSSRMINTGDRAPQKIDEHALLRLRIEPRVPAISRCPTAAAYQRSQVPQSIHDAGDFGALALVTPHDEKMSRLTTA